MIIPILISPRGVKVDPSGMLVIKMRFDKQLTTLKLSQKETSIDADVMLGWSGVFLKEACDCKVVDKETFY